MRDMASHLNQCEVLADPTLTKRKQYWSKVYGVNNLSPLCEITSFPITANLLMDAMYIICEGLACHLLGLFLHRCIIEQDLFSLDWLNNQIQQYPYPQNEMKNVLELITRHQIVGDVYVKQKAVAMLSLLFCLPHVLGQVFQLENDHYKHFIHFVSVLML